MWYSDDMLDDDQLEEFKDLYRETYEWLYDNNDEPEDDFDYYEMMDVCEVLMQEEMPILIQFVRDRMDPVSSDRELVAFAITAVKLGYVDLDA